MAGRKPKKCPHCGGKAIIAILYGMPASEAFEKAEQGKLRLGGCCEPLDGPDWFCKTCERELFGEVLEIPLMSPTKRRVVLPKVFEAYVGGWAGPSFRVRFDGRKLDYRALVFRESGDCEEVLSVEPSTGEWAAFWDAMDRIGAWSWGKTYDDPDTMDGTQWSVRIRLGRKNLSSHGSNAYPPAGDLDETSEFHQFCEAVGRLLGGREFG